MFIRIGALALTVSVLGCALPSQEAAAPAATSPQPTFRLDGRALTGPRAELDGFGELTITAEGPAGGGPVSLRIAFPELRLPLPGEYPLGAESDHGLSVKLGETACTGTLMVERCTFEHAVLHGELGADAERRAFFVDLPVTLAAARIEGAKEGRTEPAPAGEADREDLVFCALGNTGTGAPIQRRIGSSIAALAPSGPLDHVLLLGDLILPDGPSEVGDTALRRCFEEPYPHDLLPMSFYVTFGDRDHAGLLRAYGLYAQTSERLQIPQISYPFTLTCRGKDVLFVAMDTTLYSHGVGHPGMRGTNRVVTSSLRRSDADVKIVFGHQSMFGSGDEGFASKLAADLRNYQADVFADTGVDLYISASPHHMELVDTGRGFLEVVSGSGGGLVRDAAAGESSLFATAEPGFTWFRYDGETMEISFRAADGRVIHVHRFQPD